MPKFVKFTPRSDPRRRWSRHARTRTPRVGRRRKTWAGKTISVILVGLVVGVIAGLALLRLQMPPIAPMPLALQSIAPTKGAPSTFEQQQTPPARAEPSPVGVRDNRSSIDCSAPTIVDGDTLRCHDVRVRLANIDAPEMPGHCRPGRRCTPGDPYASRDFLRALTRGPIQCLQSDTDRYGRAIALCEAGGRDLSCAMVAAGHAVERYGELDCPR